MALLPYTQKKDGLTGLPSKEAFYAKAQKIVNRLDEGAYSAVYLRLVNLGMYTVRRGGEEGDKVLITVARALRKHDAFPLVGRFASGSFVAIGHTSQIESALYDINRILPSSDEADGLILKAGYCVIRDEWDADECMLRARYALEDILLSSPAYSRLFDLGLETVYNRRAYVVEHLEDAIERGEIKAYAQSIVRVLTGQICEVEVLARWESEEYGFLRPDEFVPELERHQLIHRLDAEVVRLACKQWAEASVQGINVPFGLNLSRLDFELCDMYSVVTECMQQYGVPVDQVHIEITESALAQSSEVLMSGIERFRQSGFRLYLDDFGSGYSSLQVLEGTSFDVVKLDMSLLREVEENERARVIVADAISMVKRLNLQTLCEGVETEEQFLFLKAVGCEKVQGYHFAKPMSHEEIMAHLDETAKLHESVEDQRYYDSVGKVNLIDGTRSSKYGVEAAHFLGTQPFALVEIRGQRISFMSSNAAFNRLVQSTNAKTLDGLLERLSGDLSALRNRVLYVASKAKDTHDVQRFDYVLEGSFLSAGMSYVEGSPGRDAYLLEILSLTKYSQFNDFKLLEESLRFLYTLFKRIDLLDVKEQTWRNIYLNVPRYHALRAGKTPQDEIDAFAESFIHPDDRERFYEFYDLSTVDERIMHSSRDYAADVFFALSHNNRYENQVFMIIPVSMGGHRQYLSCMRDLDAGSLEQHNRKSEGYIDDGVLLSGILDITERLVFWKDAKRRFLGANQRFMDYYGLSSIEELLGKTDEDLGWTRNPHFLADEERVLQGESISGVHGYTLAKGEYRDIKVSKMPLWHEGKVIGMVGFHVDVGPHKVSDNE